MKALIILIAALVMSQNTFARSFELVHENLNSSVFSFKNKIVNFTMTEQEAQLSIYNNICPARPGGMQCKAMPILALHAEYILELAEIDSCGVKTYVSNLVQHNPNETSRLIVKDNRYSICEIAYTSHYYVKLTINKTQENGYTEAFDSYLALNNPKLFKNEAKGYTPVE